MSEEIDVSVSVFLGGVRNEKISGSISQCLEVRARILAVTDGAVIAFQQTGLSDTMKLRFIRQPANRYFTNCQHSTRKEKSI